MPVFGSRDSSGRCILGLCCACALVALPVAAAANRKDSILTSFNRGGSEPTAPLLRDNDGNIFGTTYTGGAHNDGIVFKLLPSGHEKILHEFGGYQNDDGAGPHAGLVADAAGDLFGVTVGGGAKDSGTVYEIHSDGSETLLHEFTGGADGAQPWATLVEDAGGNLYGTAQYGGDSSCGSQGCGVVFEISPSGDEIVLYEFKAGNDGASPQTSLVMDGDGNLYGTTAGGGADDAGTAFKLAPDGTETILHSFSGQGHDGESPSGLVVDADGNLYGTTALGGKNNLGIVFKLAPDGTETVLHAFGAGSDGADPAAGLILDQKNNLYGTTSNGGTLDVGTIFKISPKGAETVLYSFRGNLKDGANRSRL